MDQGAPVGIATLLSQQVVAPHAYAGNAVPVIRITTSSKAMLPTETQRHWIGTTGDGAEKSLRKIPGRFFC